MLVEGYGLRFSSQGMSRPKNAMNPMTILRDSASTVTSTDSAPSLISSAPAMMMMMMRMVIQNMVFLLSMV